MRLSFLRLCWLVTVGVVSGCGSDPGVVVEGDASMDTGGSDSTGGKMSTGGSDSTGGKVSTGGSDATGGNATGGTEAGPTCADVTCTAPATCDDSGVSPVCVCPDGYTDDNGDGSQCTDIDECADSALNDCALRATCENTVGGFTCTCDAPIYTGDGTTCTCAPGFVPDATDSTFCVTDNGGDCADGLDCASGHCVDGICCATACVTPPPCRVAASATCADGETCVYDQVTDDGTDCEDGNTCTSGTTCSAGVCTGGVDVSDQCYASSCQAPICDSFAGCQVSATVGACDDGDPCTENTTCQPDGSCGAGTPHDCDDGLACTDDSCINNGGTPQCVHTNNSDYCGGAGCPTKDMCVNGLCQADAGVACNGCVGSPCGAGGTCVAGSGGDYTCTCGAGYLSVNGTCVCDMEGTFAVQVTAVLKYDGDPNAVLAPFDDVVVHSWIMRTHTNSGLDVLVTEQPCGGETPEVCNALTQEQYGLLPTEAYSGNIPDSAWDSPGMPKFNGQPMSLDTFLPSNAFATGNEAMVLGLVMANNDLLGLWPPARAAGTPDTLSWTNPDGDSFNGVLTIWSDSGKSSVCPRGQTPSYDLTLPPALDVQDDGQGGTVGVFTRVKYVDGASRIIKAYDGQVDDCDTISGTVTGPSTLLGYEGQYTADARVRGCRHADGSSCTDYEIAFLDGSTADAPYVKSASFVMKRMASGVTHTCAEVRATNFN